MALADLTGLAFLPIQLANNPDDCTMLRLDFLGDIHLDPCDLFRQPQANLPGLLEQPRQHLNFRDASKGTQKGKKVH